MQEKMNLDVLDGRGMAVNDVEILQKTHNGHLAEPVKVQGVVVSHLCVQPDDREHGGIFQRVH